MRTLPLTALLALAALGLAACGDEKPAETTPPPAVQAITAPAGSQQAAVVATGRIERRREMTLSFRIGGVMTAMNVEAGDPVRTGQALASIDSSGVDAGQARASADVERARRDLERDRALFEKGYVSKQRMDDRASALKVAQASLSAAAFDRRWASLTSPVSGVVLERLAQAGEVVAPGQAVLRVADLNSPLVLRVPIPDREVARLRAGAPAQVKLAEGGGLLTGRITRIGQQSGARTGAVEVEIELAAAPGLRSGQIATAEIAASPLPGATNQMVRIPAEAIIEAQGASAHVFVIEGDIARRRPVRFGGFDGDDALVAGLPAGARIATAGAGFIGDGDKVRVIDPAALNAAPVKAAR
ncbi:efflux RND transporter periplasmic adaptor subunit [Caulobacter sp. NIBR2454]|uniref:efflux RND transporter periplasmic adaptor subunit n=1 Tax=Caulobacter sp. NIBR2454 TaxID=3015996 RepID=UPI002FC366DE